MERTHQTRIRFEPQARFTLILEVWETAMISDIALYCRFVFSSLAAGPDQLFQHRVDFAS